MDSVGSVSVVADEAQLPIAAPATKKANPKKVSLKKLAEAARTPYVPVLEPKEELRKLVGQREAMEKVIVALKNQTTVKKILKGPRKGELIACSLPEDVRAVWLDDIAAKEKAMGDHDKKIREVLKLIPFYDKFLRHVYGLSYVTAGYICALVDFERCPKPSNLRTFCGLGIDNVTGRADRARRRVEGETVAPKLRYNAALKKKLYLCLKSMRMNKRNGDNKYLIHWRNKKATALAEFEQLCKARDRGELDGATLSRLARMAPRDGGSKGFADHKGRRKATDLLLEDIYTVGRAMAGLPVFPDWYAAKLGYKHGTDRIQVSSPTMLTFEQAIETIGNFGRMDPPAGLVVDLGEEDEDEDYDGEDDL